MVLSYIMPFDRQRFLLVLQLVCASPSLSKIKTVYTCSLVRDYLLYLQSPFSSNKRIHPSFDLEQYSISTQEAFLPCFSVTHIMFFCFTLVTTSDRVLGAESCQNVGDLHYVPERTLCSQREHCCSHYVDTVLE